MKQKLLRYIPACLVAMVLLSAVAFAAKDASEYILKTTISMSTSTPGIVEANCIIVATDIYPDVGIKWIEFHKADGTLVGKRHWYTDPGYSYLMDHNTGSHAASVTCPAVDGEKYYAKVCFWAGELGVAGDVYTMNSLIVP